MKLRFDLVEKITPEMLMESVLANNHRYKAEPLSSPPIARSTGREKPMPDWLRNRIRRRMAALWPQP